MLIAVQTPSRPLRVLSTSSLSMIGVVIGIKIDTQGSCASLRPVTLSHRGSQSCWQTVTVSSCCATLGFCYNNGERNGDGTNIFPVFLASRSTSFSRLAMPDESIDITSFAFVLQLVEYMLNTRPRSSWRLFGKYPFTLDR